MDSKEKVKDFNQHFLSLRNRIPVDTGPTEGVVMEFYTSSLPQTMAMFVKQKEKTTLQGNFAEAIRVEKDIANLKVNQGNDKPSSSKNPIKTHMDRKEQDAFDIEGLQRVVKQLSNEIISLKNNSGEGTSGKGFFIFSNKKYFPPRQHPPPENINIQDYTMYNFFHAHKDNHSEKKIVLHLLMCSIYLPQAKQTLLF
jgi:hypothetical protein